MSKPSDGLSKPTELGPGEYIISPMDLEQLLHLKAALAQGLQEFLVALRPAAVRAAAALNGLGEALQQAGLVADVPPSDPRERALWAARSRGTGPAVPKAWHRR